jgi:secondary thiamine-phosphate synthase enzyme
MACSVNCRNRARCRLSSRPRLHWLSALNLHKHLCVPWWPDYKHHRTGEDNGDAHLKSILVHHQVIVPITAGALDVGPWQQIFYAEFDGLRSKRLVIKAMGE